jgi:LruC domain-containing protein
VLLNYCAFEDLWPYYGDYDFNDVAFKLSSSTKLNAKGLAVQMDLSVMLNQTSWFTNGIGIELGNLSHLK